jgi:hypothetical protein
MKKTSSEAVQGTAGLPVEDPLSWKSAVPDLGMNVVLPGMGVDYVLEGIKKRIQKPAFRHLTSEPVVDTKPFMEDLMAKYPPKVMPSIKEILDSTESYYDGRKNVFGLPKKIQPFIAAHELGHATGRKNLTLALTRVLGLPLALGALGTTAHSVRSAVRGDAEEPLSNKLTPVLAGASLAAVQAEELRATLRALKMLKGTPHAKGALGRAAIQQLAGYALPFGVMVGSMAFGANRLNKFREDRYKLRQEGTMKKTASEIADEVLEKCAMRAGVKRVLSHLDSTPGLRGFKEWHRMATRDPSRKFTEALSGNKKDDLFGLLDRFIGDTGRPVSKTLSKRLTPFARGTGGLSKMVGDSINKADVQGIRQSISGRHGPRPGEILIPATTDPLSSARLGTSAKPKVFFRGNPRPTRGATYMSRHPDVAAHYALKHPDLVGGPAAEAAYRAFGIKLPPLTPSTGRLFAYSGKDLNTGFGEVPGGVFRNKALRVPAEEARDTARKFIDSSRLSGLKGSKTLQEAEHQLKGNPTYEKVVRANVKPKLLGEYIPRPSRTAEGAPAFAISRVRGQAPEKVFRDSIGKQSPLYSDLR